MARSKLAAQLAEAARQAKNLNTEAERFQGLKGAFSADLSAGIPGGEGGGAAGVPGAPGVPGAQLGGSLQVASIGEFLARLAGRSGGGIGTGASGGAGGRIRERAATPEESLQAKALGESVEYLRELMKAASWAGLPAAMVLRAPKEERDALIAAYEASSASGIGSNSAGGEHRVGIDRLPPDIAGGAAGAARLAYGGFSWERGAATAGATQASQAAKSAADPTAAIASGAQATVGALGAVVQELRRLNTNVERKGTGVEYRTGGLT